MRRAVCAPVSPHAHLVRPDPCGRFVSYTVGVRLRAVTSCHSLTPVFDTSLLLLIHEFLEIKDLLVLQQRIHCAP